MLLQFPHKELLLIVGTDSILVYLKIQTTEAKGRGEGEGGYAK